jgi:hypothetical protein
MDRMPWTTYLWPGLPQIRSEGCWSALALSIGFAALVNLALVATLVWSELFTTGVRNSVWVATVAIWGGSAMISYLWDYRYRAASETAPAEDAFTEAQEHYLKGNWFESEHVLRDLLRGNPRDLDVGLMLATLLRRTDRREEAEIELDRLGRLDGAEKWELEISRERELLHQAEREGSSPSVEPTDTAVADPPTETADAA